ncbi:MAG: thiamine pyrophosphate-dependent enzyme [Omnitrophica WOR_2 bacterium]
MADSRAGLKQAESRTVKDQNHTAPSIDWLKAARFMLLSRQIDRLEVEQLTPQGKVKYQFSAGGHELVQVLLALELDHPHDAAGVYYRSRPFLLASGLSASEALSAGMALTGSPSEGRDVGVVFNLPRRTGATVLPASGDVGSQYTPTVGWAQAIRYRQSVLDEEEWQEALAACMGGDGSVATNGFWSALTIATTLGLPMLIMIEDNGYGISVPAGLQTPGGNIASNLSAFANLKVLEGDGWEPLDTLEKIREAVRYVRSGEGPCLLRMRVARLAGHTFIDDQSYKSAELRALEAERDPLDRLKEFVLSQGVTQETWERLDQEVRQELQEALREAESNLAPDANQVTHSLWFEGVVPTQGGLRPENVLIQPGEDIPHPSGPRVNMIDAIRRTLENEMRLNPRILVFGEDVGAKGGVHGATLDMQSHFGPERVFDTSLSEEGIIGRSTGMALAGLLPVPEIQFRKYADPAYEQLNDLGILRWRTANKFAAPVVVRMPVGFSKKTGDPWHSVTGEAVYAHMLGWRIAFPSNAGDAAGLLRTALRGDDPTFFLEHRALLDTAEGRRPYPGDDYCLPFGQAARLAEGGELTLITWGAMVPRCLEATRPLQGRIDLLDLRTIRPWDQEHVLESVRKTGKVLIVHEDTLTAGFAGEITAAIAEQAFTFLDAPVTRMTMPDCPVPFHVPTMEALLPNPVSIREKVEYLLSY